MWRKGLSFAVAVICTIALAPNALGAPNGNGGGNNGGSTTEIVVSFAANSTEVETGTSVQLSWASSGARSCWASGQAGWEGKHPAQGVFTTLPLSASTTFSISCGAKSARVSKTAVVTVNQSEPIDPPIPPEPEPVNEAPVVNAGANQAVEFNQNAALSGSVTDDGLPSAAPTVQWALVSGPGAVSFGNQTNVATSATFSDAGTYVLRLSANDGELQGNDEVSVTVNSSADPALVFTVDQSEVAVNDVVNLTWSAQHVSNCQASGQWSGDQSVEGTVSFAVSAYSTFTLTCSSSTGTVTRMVSVLVRNMNVEWEAPTENVDGSVITNLSGFRIYSLNNGNYQLEAEITTPGVNNAALAKPSGNYDLAMTAIDANGNESAYSNTVSKVSP